MLASQTWGDDLTLLAQWRGRLAGADGARASSASRARAAQLEALQALLARYQAGEFAPPESWYGADAPEV
jgi:hypothetical protein